MKWIAVILVLLALVAGCGGAKRKAFAPKPHPIEEQEYLAGFMDGYRGARPMDPHLSDRKGSSCTSPYSQGVRDGYITGRKDEMQRR